MRLIDADRIIPYMERMVEAADDRCRKTEANDPWHGRYRTQRDERVEALLLIENAPTVDAVPVTRCRDCSWHDDDGCCLNPKCGKSWYGCPVNSNHYCSYGERKVRQE